MNDHVIRMIVDDYVMQIREGFKNPSNGNFPLRGGGTVDHDVEIGKSTRKTKQAFRGC